MAVFKKQGVYWIDYYVNGRRKRERISRDRRLARGGETEALVRFCGQVFSGVQVLRPQNSFRHDQISLIGQVGQDLWTTYTLSSETQNTRTSRARRPPHGNL
jgi:hypothetical protein